MTSPTTPGSTSDGSASRRLGRVLATVAQMLMIVGGLNWALVGLLDFDIVAAVFGPMSLPARTAYVVIGLAATYGVTLLPRIGAEA